MFGTQTKALTNSAMTATNVSGPNDYFFTSMRQKKMMTTHQRHYFARMLRYQVEVVSARQRNA
jgi:hypothetical protein